MLNKNKKIVAGAFMLLACLLCKRSVRDYLWIVQHKLRETKWSSDERSSADRVLNRCEYGCDPNYYYRASSSGSPCAYERRCQEDSFYGGSSYGGSSYGGSFYDGSLYDCGL